MTTPEMRNMNLREYTRAYYQLNRERILARLRERYRHEPAYRERVQRCSRAVQQRRRESRRQATTP